MDFCYLRLLLILVLPAIGSYRLPDTSTDNDANTSFSVPNGPDKVPLQTFDPDMVMQVGAFRKESNALALKERLSHLLNKPLIIYTADGFFKVRITGFTSQEDMEKIIPTLGLLGIKNIWVFRPVDMDDAMTKVDLQPVASVKAVNEKINTPDAVMQPDTTLKTAEVKINSPDLATDKPVTTVQPLSLQVGVFHGNSKALRAQRRITAKLNLPVVIVREWEYYIVIITGFKTREEISKYYPVLAAMGYPDCTMIENNNK
jgi:cell division protein FtsN